MIFALLCLFTTFAGGALWTYMYDDDCVPVNRLVEGAFIGWALWGLSGFAIASYSGGITSTGITLSVYSVIFPPLLYTILRKKKIFLGDLRSFYKIIRLKIKTPRSYIISLGFYILAIIGLWLSLSGGVYMRDETIYTRNIDNYADFTLHAGIINSFVYGENFPPEHPDYAGSRLTYPFLVDFIAAMLVSMGLPLVSAIFIQSFTFLVFFISLLHIWVRQFTKSNAVVVMVISLILLNGGLGWVMGITEFFASAKSLWEYLLYLPHDYTAHGETIRWVNSVMYWFIPMRSMLLGVPLFLVVSNLWWRAIPKIRTVAKPEWKHIRQMVGAGFIAALLPLSHGHSFLTLFIVGVVMLVLSRSFILWGIFFMVATILSLPQITWLSTGSAASFYDFFGPIWGWNQAEKNILWFWFVNTGVFIPLLALALLKRKLLERKYILFYLPFLLCFIIPNFIKVAPWEWDNVKILVYWYIFSTVPVALLLEHWWKKGRLWKVLVSVIFISMTLAGIGDNWRSWTIAGEVVIYDSDALQVAEYIKQKLPPRSLLLTAPIHNNVTLMSGRRSYFGYPGRVWTHGLPWVPRDEEVKIIYSGGDAAKRLLESRKIDYVIIGPPERDWAKDQKVVLNENFFTQYPLVAAVAKTKIYRLIP